MCPKSFPSNIQSPVKKVKYICAGNQRPTLPAPHSCEPRPPVSLTSWALRITSWRHAFTLCRNKLWKFKKFCDNLRRTKGGRELDRGRVTSEHRCIGGRLAAKPAPFTLNCVEDFDSLYFAWSGQRCRSGTDDVATSNRTVANILLGHWHFKNIN